MPDFAGQPEEKIGYFLFIFKILGVSPPPLPLAFSKNLQDTMAVSELKIYKICGDRVSKSHFYSAESETFR